MYRAGQEMVLLEPWQLKMFKEPQRTEGLCVLVQGGDDGVAPTTYCDVSVHRMFPLSQPENLIALCDKHGNEIGVVEDPTDLDEKSRQALLKELELAYFIPEITRIYEIKEEYGVVGWDVETDRGARQFEVRSRHDIRPMGQGRYVVRDMDGNRYDIPNINALDNASRNLLEMEV